MSSARSAGSYSRSASKIAAYSPRARATDEGKKLTALDGFRVLGTLMRCRFTPNSAPNVRT